MKIQLSKKTLKNALDMIVAVVPSKPVIQLLSNMLVEVIENRIILYASDTESTLRVSVDCTARVEEDEKNMFLIPPALLRGLAGDDGVITLTKRNGTLVVSDGVFSAELVTNVESVNEFPRGNFAHWDKSTSTFVTVSTANLLKALKCVMFSASKDEVLANYHAVHFGFRNNIVRLSSTDGYRLSDYTLYPSDCNFTDGFSALVPLNTVTLLTKLIKSKSGDEEEDNIDIFVSEKEILFRRGNVQLDGLLSNAKFPNIDAVMPKTFAAKAVVTGSELMAAVKRAAALQSLFCRFAFNGSSIVVVHGRSDYGTLDVDVPASETSGEVFFALNTEFLRQFLDVAGEGVIILQAINEKAPVLLKASGLPDYVHLIMTMEVRGN